ncbi:hypothetical protein BDZ85DRAFT_258049 [Elsinoe ampelina]|uniref:Uncharacterized protein n=1 Tax=Elsinoe ampelina TaxID=302913 RepID=A0A6A6GJE2_9PEZI|nr:hypothetical protein BDZ85DRAFT_258049 [Elsinoe ampelina]
MRWYPFLVVGVSPFGTCLISETQEIVTDGGTCVDAWQPHDIESVEMILPASIMHCFTSCHYIILGSSGYVVSELA